MNEFFSISQPNTKPINEYQLENLGIERTTISWGKRVRDGYGGTSYQTRGIKQQVKSEDYDDAFAFKLTRIKPVYDLEKLLDYHLDTYIENKGNRDKFLKHIRYVILQYIQKHYTDATACMELVEKWLVENEKAYSAMIEYTELTHQERHVVNKFIQSVPANVRHSSTIWFDKKEIDDLIQDNVEYHSKRVIEFLLANDFIKLRTYKPTYELLDAGKKLLNCGSVEKFYERMQNQNNPSIVGNGNVVNISGGDIHQSGVTITFTQTQYEQLKGLGVEEDKIEELREIVSRNKSDKPTLKTQVFKWLGDVTKAVATKGLTDNLPQITEFVGNLIN